MAKILLVEDDSNLREIFEMRLQAEGYQTVVAGDGEEGLTVAVKEKPDLIISDVMMPKISGFEMLENLRAVPELKDTKVMMMTALGQAEDQARGNRLGVVKYLVKSQVTLEDFARVVHEVLGDAPSGAAPTSSGDAPTEEGPSTNNKQESEANMPEDSTNPTPTNPAAPAGPADSSAPTNPITGDAGVGSDQQSSSQEQSAVQDQINNFVSTPPAGAPDMPAPDAPATDVPAADTSTYQPPAAPAATPEPSAAPAPSMPAPDPSVPAMPPADTTPPADASSTTPAGDSTANTI